MGVSPQKTPKMELPCQLSNSSGITGGWAGLEKRIVVPQFPLPKDICEEGLGMAGWTPALSRYRSAIVT